MRFTHGGTTWLFLRILGVVYFVAFASLAVQIAALVGPQGIVPGPPWATDAMLRALTLGGAALALLLVVGLAPIPVLLLLWTDYLVVSNVGAEFLSYQWDALLLETGLLALFVAPPVWRERSDRLSDPPRLARGLMLWLLFRLMVGSGAVKLASGDPTWRGLTAMTFHYETQPIPTPLAWYAHLLPLWFQQASTAAVLAIEIGAPSVMFGPRRVRVAGFAALVGLQLLIALTGNYAFFNLLSAALCLFLLGEAGPKGPALRTPEVRRPGLLGEAGPKGPALRTPEVRRPGLLGEAGPKGPALRTPEVRRPGPVDPASGSPADPARLDRARGVQRAATFAFAIVTVPVSVAMFLASLGVYFAPPPIVALADAIAPLHSVNSYGLFAVMTTTRDEIVIEGSNDGQAWQPYEFRYKPGDVNRRPPWVAPHQPRLDWQMWFASLTTYENVPWFTTLCSRLLEGSPGVLALLAHNPFPDHPPRFIRAELYRYHYGTQTWWVRARVGDYSSVMRLSDAEQP